MPRRKKAPPPKKASRGNTVFLVCAILLLNGLALGTVLLILSTPKERHFCGNWLSRQVSGLGRWLPRANSSSPQPTRSQDDEKYYAYAGLPVSVTYPYAISTFTNIAYTVGYCEVRKGPAWVAYRLFQPENRHEMEPVSLPLRADLRTVSQIRSDQLAHVDFLPELLASANPIGICYGKDAWKETFLMSNITPRHWRLRDLLWNEWDNQLSRRMTSRFREVWVVSGAVFPSVAVKIGPGIAIPSAYYHILLVESEGRPKIMSFLLPQQPAHQPGKQEWNDFLVSINELEARTGFDFFPSLKNSNQTSLEARPSPLPW